MPNGSLPSRTEFIRPLAGRFWRSTFVETAHSLTQPASAPNGRWHHGGQTALYLSGSPEGCTVALKVYLRQDDLPRGIFPLDVIAQRIVDLRDARVRDAFEVSLTDIHAFWNDYVQAGETSPTWELSDQLRGLGVEGILSPSRSRPDLTHLTLFNWNTPDGPTVARDGAPLEWPGRG